MSTGGFIKGLMAGAAIGAMVGIVFDPVKERDRKHMKKRVGKMMKNAGSILDTFHI